MLCIRAYIEHHTAVVRVQRDRDRDRSVCAHEKKRQVCVCELVGYMRALRNALAND